ncbi:arginine-tRNA-protein transferase 1 [Tothia fuscella]|uniref:Arginyl-tRNA--protein transferase 1 n=1 Tax=Tothia fuscella TaxID=1048955 RepID=A0A9P4NX55_9PEZI|nr:arginine-tRNA-protein transferase 1 [Tothia fuscella]
MRSALFQITTRCASYYLSAKTLTPQHYQILVDRGWRRSGIILYKPDLQHSCCPHYTIRLPVDELKARADQRKCISRWNRHVLGEQYIKDSAKTQSKPKKVKGDQDQAPYDLRHAIHEAEFDLLDRPGESDHKFEVTLEKDIFTLEKYKLYQNYQHNVHHDPMDKITRDGFRRFLCDSPLNRTEPDEVNGVGRKLGSYHQCYRYDGRLIALGVLDLLPHCVSGVYFIYHSDFSKWSFGKLSALREACLALEGGYQFYYMGYYIHSCPKMRYKNDYSPQYILDLENFEWSPLDDEFRRLLDGKKYVSMSLRRQSDENDSLVGHTVDKEARQDSLPGPEINPRRVVFDSAEEAVDAVRDDLSLFDLNFPGMMTEAELEKTVNLDSIVLALEGDQLVMCQMLVSWLKSDIRDGSLKSIIAQMVACIGTEVSKTMVVDFRRS